MVAAADGRDRVGLGWRKELSASILMNGGAIDVVEVIVDDFFEASGKQFDAMHTLSSQVPVLYHGVGLGLASSIPLEQKRVDRLARTLERLKAEYWSEHLAFVRAGGIEIGHLAAPPRNLSTIEGACRNLAMVRRTVGSLPALENIATLIDPPGSSLSESQWIQAIVGESKAECLLDLHNLYANALNQRLDPVQVLLSYPLESVQSIHLSGGHWLPEPTRFGGGASKRLLDDHIHDVPSEVFDLLEIVANRVSRPLTVIIERDGHYPEFHVLLNQVHRARQALRKGRAGRGDASREVYERASL